MNTFKITLNLFQLLEHGGEGVNLLPLDQHKIKKKVLHNGIFSFAIFLYSKIEITSR